MAETVDTIEVRFTAVGQQTAVTAFDQVSAASAKSEASVKKFDAAVEGASKRSFGSFNEAAGKGAKLLGTFSMAAAAAEPALGKFGQTANQVSGTIMTFGSYLGGPWGIALGLGVLAVNQFAGALQAVEEQAKKADEAIKRLQARTTKVKDVESSAVFFEQDRMLRPGDPGFDDAMRLHEASGGSKARGGKLLDPNAKPGSDRRGAGPEFEALQRREENDRRMAELDAKAREAERSQIAEELTREQAAADARLETKRNELDQRFAMENETRERTRAAEDAMYAQSAAAAEANGKVMRDVGAQAFNAVGSAGLGAFRKLAQGQKVSTKEVLNSIGEQIAATGQGHILQAGAMFFIPGMQASAGGLLAAGAAELAFGIGLGAATSGGGGGGSRRSRGVAGRDYAGAGESGSDYLDRTRAGSPGSSRYRGGGGGSTTYVVVHMPTVVSPSADDGARIKAALREADRAGV